MGILKHKKDLLLFLFTLLLVVIIVLFGLIYFNKINKTTSIIGEKPGLTSNTDKILSLP